jgi:hypothetical protein
MSNTDLEPKDHIAVAFYSTIIYFNFTLILSGNLVLGLIGALLCRAMYRSFLAWAVIRKEERK